MRYALFSMVRIRRFWLFPSLISSSLLFTPAKMTLSLECTQRLMHPSSRGENKCSETEDNSRFVILKRLIVFLTPAFVAPPPPPTRTKSSFGVKQTEKTGHPTLARLLLAI